MPKDSALVDLILVPAVLHTPWHEFREYPPAVQALTRSLLLTHIASGHGLNTQVIGNA